MRTSTWQHTVQAGELDSSSWSGELIESGSRRHARLRHILTECDVSPFAHSPVYRFRHARNSLLALVLWHRRCLPLYLAQVSSRWLLFFVLPPETVQVRSAGVVATRRKQGGQDTHGSFFLHRKKCTSRVHRHQLAGKEARNRLRSSPAAGQTGNHWFVATCPLFGPANIDSSRTFACIRPSIIPKRTRTYDIGSTTAPVPIAYDARRLPAIIFFPAHMAGPPLGRAGVGRAGNGGHGTQVA